MRVPILVLIALLAAVCWFYEFQIPETDNIQKLVALDFALVPAQCSLDESTVCTFMLCSGRVTRKLLSNTVQRSPCIVGVNHSRMVKSNFTQPQAAGVTIYPDVQHVNDADACERWFNAGNAHQLIREYIERAIPATGISRAVTYQRGLSTGARFLVVWVRIIPSSCWWRSRLTRWSSIPTRM